jgi:hypothetical protein
MSYGVNLNQRLAGTKSIGAVATEKVQSDALNLGFPSAYQSVYAAKRIPERFFPTKEYSPMTMWAGNDLQSQYHEQKRVDADYMAGAKVRATQLSRMRYVGTPHGRGLLPHAVLGQRVFANPNNGAQPSASGRQNHSDAPFYYSGGGDYVSEFKGGVLRSAKGQAHGIARLRDRVGQLNAIATAAADFTSGTMPSSSGAPTQSINPSAVSPSIELNLLLQQILDSLNGLGEDSGSKLDKFDLATASRALGLIFRMVPEANSDFVEDTQAKVQTILELVNGALDDETESAGMSSTARETALSLQVIFTKLNVYLTRMIAGAPVQRQETKFNPLTGQQETQNVLSQEQGQNLSNPERLALSKNLVSSLGFSKMLKYAVDADPSGMLSEAQRDRLFTSQQAQRYAVGDMDEDDDDDDGDFDRPAGPRENEAHDRETGMSRSARDFDEDERQVFGFNSGMYFPRNGRGEDEYFGESEAQERQSTAPSSFVGQRDQRRGHQNRERTASNVSSAVERVSGRFDPDTQGFNLDIGALPVQPASAPRPPPPTGEASVASSRRTRSTATRSRKSTGTKHYSKLPTEFAQVNRREGRERYYLDDDGTVYDRHPTPASSVSSKKSSVKPPPAPKAPASSVIPTRQRDLPTTREGYDELAKKINKAGGINGSFIQVYSGSSVANIKKNFVKRLGLAGKY